MRRLNPMKYIQRRELIKNMPRDGTILEVYGGKGNLTRSVYKGKARHHIIIDKNPSNRLASLVGPRKVEVVPKYADRWLREDLPQTLTT